MNITAGQLPVGARFFWDASTDYAYDGRLEIVARVETEDGAQIKVRYDDGSIGYVFPSERVRVST